MRRASLTITAASAARSPALPLIALVAFAALVVLLSSTTAPGHSAFFPLASALPALSSLIATSALPAVASLSARTALALLLPAVALVALAVLTVCHGRYSVSEVRVLRAALGGKRRHAFRYSMPALYVLYASFALQLVEVDAVHRHPASAAMPQLVTHRYFATFHDGGVLPSA